MDMSWQTDTALHERLQLECSEWRPDLVGVFLVTYRRGMLYSTRHRQSYLLHPNPSL